ncbi:MAG TPA: hypothetical protein VN157_06835 [Caulobacter sp.]|nr:hypothetical protein [Caulobacter sp.]
MILSLDTNVMIDICNGRAGVRERFDQAVEDGFEIVVNPVASEDSLVAARIRQDLRKAGRSIGAYDLLIAGQALNRGRTMVSANLREYTRVENLRVVDWTRPASHQTED